MLESFLLWLTVAFVVITVGAVLGYFALRWVFMRASERFAAMVDRRVGGVAARAFTGMARYAQSRGIGVDEAQRIFGVQIDRLAKIMDSAITLPIVGRVGLDAVLDLVPVFGNFTGAAISLTLIARALRYGPPPSLVSKMLSNVLVDVIVGAIPLIGPLVDLWWKANDKNASLMREFLASRADDVGSRI
ncbi:MAG TPA: DUF4112 domain-containing protein [Vicinamibacterales bacterium]|nr:DUF4112 domain-containing protein [Vicinamibacterales bacterium]